MNFYGKDIDWFKLNHPERYKRYVRKQTLKKKYEV